MPAAEGGGSCCASREEPSSLTGHSLLPLPTPPDAAAQTPQIKTAHSKGSWSLLCPNDWLLSTATPFAGSQITLPRQSVAQASNSRSGAGTRAEAKGPCGLGCFLRISHTWEKAVESYAVGHNSSVPRRPRERWAPSKTTPPSGQQAALSFRCLSHGPKPTPLQSSQARRLWSQT